MTDKFTRAGLERTKKVQFLISLRVFNCEYSIMGVTRCDVRALSSEIVTSSNPVALRAALVRQKTLPASNFADATAMRLTLSPLGMTAIMAGTRPRSS
jgi:hypothetical protein